MLAEDAKTGNNVVITPVSERMYAVDEVPMDDNIPGNEKFSSPGYLQGRRT